MPTSNTATYNPDIIEIFEIAMMNASGAPNASGYDARHMSRLLNMLSIQLNNRGLNFFTLDTQTITLVSGTATYTLPSDTLDIVDAQLRINAGTTSQVDYVRRRRSKTEYDSIPNKTTQGQPVTYYMDRQSATNTVTFWPVPDASQPYTFVYNRMRRIQDAGAYTNTVDYPFRFLPVVTAGLAYYYAMSKPDLMQRVPMLQAEFETQYKYAKRSDSDRASTWVYPASNTR